ncbi:MAG: DUF362 domain-containing protein [Deltaproteobacteria bacterium]|nr:DUF362 domain-containing protein [Deltaproteobacteria bacterium]
MNRRTFIKASLVTGAAFTIPGIGNPFINSFYAAEKVDLAVAVGPLPESITRSAVDALGGMKKFISRGDVVVVKPNIGWDRRAEYAATTNPEVVATVVRLCYEAGAKRVKVFDRPCTDPRRSYKQSGIADAAEEAGAVVSFLDERKFRDVKLSGIALKSWPLYTEIFEADKIINIPIAKDHGLSTLTLGMKNWMGVMGGWRGRIHQRIDESLVDLSLAIRPTLIILDAVRILTANGPQGGDLSDVKKLDTVIVGTDQVAVDAYGATLFGLSGKDLGFVVEGAKAGLGQMDLTKLNIERIKIS